MSGCTKAGVRMEEQESKLEGGTVAVDKVKQEAQVAVSSFCTSHRELCHRLQKAPVVKMVGSDGLSDNVGEEPGGVSSAPKLISHKLKLSFPLAYSSSALISLNRSEGKWVRVFASATEAEVDRKGNDTFFADQVGGCVSPKL
ncbi:hypothetical protein Bca52824_020241 [Brassica carinata]|uniref:Uncharacterized protein n=1 Tax=Brassica carinata TaxID=52824 RepID=A0A8X7VTD0_BRACI|nr:hypothetical protein Bca52824_020241 [Brassica carinata]